MTVPARDTPMLPRASSTVRGAEHIMAMPARSARRWSTSDVRALMDETRPWPRLELIGGELIVTPAPGGVHQVAVVESTRILADYCDRERVGIVLDSPADLELIPEPSRNPTSSSCPTRSSQRRIGSPGIRVARRSRS